MNSNEGQPADTEIQEKYETTVLDFLDREMATVQEAQQKNQHSDELDALVTDLLKQVITEADQKNQGEDRPLFDDDELFSGLTSSQKQVFGSISTDSIPEADKPADTDQSLLQAEPTPRVETQVTVRSPEPAGVFKAAAVPAAVFGSSVTPQKKFPVMIAAAAAVLVTIGAAAYFFTDISGKAPNVSEPAAATQSVKPELQTARAPVSAATTNIGRPVQPVTAVSPKKVVGAAAQAKPGTTQPSVQQPGKPAVANAKAEQAPAVTAKGPAEEQPVVAQSVPVTPMPTQIAATIEKPSSPPVSENPAPSVASSPERKPTPPQQTASVSEPPAMSASLAAPPVSGANKLISAVPLLQTSPVYPEVALRAKASGSVVLELQIDDQGKVVKATPVSGPAIFHNAAVAAVRKWRYKPASIGGVNVSSQSRVTMAFNMKK